MAQPTARTRHGFHDLLFGWLDTISDNYPCLPPDFSVCLSWDVFEVVFGLLSHFVPPAAELLFDEALNHRLGTKGLQVPELFMTAAMQGLKLGELVTLVEQDEWLYNTTRDGVVTQGRSMVCCVFVCSLWKAAGVFGSMSDAINCAELTNADDYALSIMQAPSPRPPQCVQADPLNALCQRERVNMRCCWPPSPSSSPTSIWRSDARARRRSTRSHSTAERKLQHAFRRQRRRVRRGGTGGTTSPPPPPHRGAAARRA